MYEPDVTLTDYALTLLSVYFAFRLKNCALHPQTVKSAWLGFFISVALAALAGGTVHGFFPDAESFGHRALWLLTLLAIGVTTVCAWMLAGFLLTGAKKLSLWTAFALLGFLAYSGVVIFYSRSFTIVIANYAPAMLMFLLAAVLRRRKHLIIGLLISFLAAYIQQAQIALHPVYFNHNSFYHLIQAIGLAYLYSGAKQQGESA